MLIRINYGKLVSGLIIAGIDEAGRGPCIGPMVLGIAVMHKSDESKLLEIGVKDSKQLAPDVRTRQSIQLKQCLLEFGFEKIHAQELDELMDRKSLNEIEAMKIASLLNGLKNKPEVVFVDSPDVIPKNFAVRIKKYLNFAPTIFSEHKADQNHPIVSAASVLAKVQRDREIELLAEKHGELGSGYPHDEITINFLKKWLETNDSFPSFVRKKWLTNQRMLNEKFQTKLF